MNTNYLNLKAGIRSSKLSILQSEDAISKLKALFQSLKIQLVKFSSPGDRDKITPITEAPEDFFTKDLDTAIINSEIDFAIHSAKDLPSNFNTEIDMSYLPWADDSRDALVVRLGWDIKSDSPRVGLSSQRREDYARKRWVNVKVLPIRGNIEERISQLDTGCFDAIIIAAAALNRLDMSYRISEFISEKDLPTPDGQGHLAITFRKGNTIFKEIKQILLKPVIFAGAGIGNCDFASVATVKALTKCDICLYDALLDPKLLECLSEYSKAVYVGKRAGGDSIKQKSISEMIVYYARQGKKVVRLKGGDPGLFGRLTEEITPLEDLNIPFFVIPGINSISVATTATGLLLTKRDVSRGFSVATLQKAGSSEPIPISSNEALSFPMVFLMATSKIRYLKDYLLSTGKTQTEPLTVVFNAGCLDQQFLFSTLDKIEQDLTPYKLEDPSIIIVGHSSEASNLFKRKGALNGRKVLLTCSKAIYSKGEDAVMSYLGKPIPMPLIETKLNSKSLALADIFGEIDSFDWIILTSPSSIRHFLEAIKIFHTDIRRVPKIFVYGKQSEIELKTFNIAADASGDGNLEGSIFKAIPEGSKVLRLRSDIATNQLSNKLIANGYLVKDEILYLTLEKQYDKLPEFDDIIFASASAVKSFIIQFGKDALSKKRISVIGNPTEKVLRESANNISVIKAPNESISSCITVLALDSVNKNLLKFSKNSNVKVLAK